MAHIINDPTGATTYLTTHEAFPNNANTLRIFQVCASVDTVFDTCGLTVRQKLSLIRQGINTVPRLRLLGTTYESIRNSLKPIMALPVTRGGCEFGINIITSLAALTSFYQDRRRRGLLLHANIFDDEALDSWMDRVINVADDDSDDELVPGPGTLTVDNFLMWKESLDLKLRSMIGHAQAPLYYVIRPPLPPNHDGTFDDAEEKLIYETRQQGHEWRKDNKKVARYVLGLVQPTDGFQWIRDIPTSDGKAIVQELVDHYEGEGHSQRNVESARYTVETLVYQNESVFSWETFSTRIKQAFDILQRHNVPVPLSEQLHTIRKKVRTSNTEFNALAKGVLTGNHDQSLTWHLSQVAVHVATEFPRGIHSKTLYKRKVSAIHEVPQEEERPYKIQRRNGKEFCNGIDVTTRVRRYPHAEWRKLPKALQREIYNAKRNSDTAPAPHGPQVSELQATVAAMNVQIEELRRHAAGTNTRNGDQDDRDNRRVSFGPPTGQLQRPRDT